MHYETLGTEELDGFEVVLSVAPEDLHPADCFDTSTDPETGKPYWDADEICRKIDSGSLCWFVARVQAFKAGILLGEDYLGGNLYEDPAEFLTESGGYYQDMRDAVLTQARAAIQKLTEAA